MKFYFVAYFIHLSFHLFRVSRNSYITSPNNYRGIRWKMKFEDSDKNLTEKKTYLEVSRLIFQCAVVQQFFEIFCQSFSLRNFCDRKFLREAFLIFSQIFQKSC